jgi:hypothetical protein
MSEESFLGYIIVGTVAYLLGRWVGRTATLLQITKNLIENPDNLNEVIKRYKNSIQEAQREEGIPEDIEVEKHGEQIFLFTKQGEFLSQGLDLQEALEKAASRFPDRTFKGRLTKTEAEGMGINVSKP